MLSPIRITLSNPLNRKQQIDYWIQPNDSQLAKDWVTQLEKIVLQGNHLEKNYCFMGWVEGPRSLPLLCEELQRAVDQINRYNCTGAWQSKGLKSYYIEDYFCPQTVMFPLDLPKASGGFDPAKLGLQLKHEVMNRLHNHFEVLQGTVENISQYFNHADAETKYAIRQLNNLCHEIESLALSIRKFAVAPEWVRPSQITTFFKAPRTLLTDTHRTGFAENGYDRKFGHVYMHWCQIGKTLFEVFRDEGAPKLDDATCEAITHLQYYSGEFDIEWGKDVTRHNDCPWHDEEQNKFESWLKDNGYDPDDPKLSLGYLHIGEVDIEKSFGTDNRMDIWEALATHLDIYSIEVNGKTAIYDYSWSDIDFEQQQMKSLGYEVD